MSRDQADREFAKITKLVKTRNYRLSELLADDQLVCEVSKSFPSFKEFIQSLSKNSKEDLKRFRAWSKEDNNKIERYNSEHSIDKSNQLPEV